MKKLQITLLLASSLLLTQCGIIDQIKTLFEDTTTRTINAIDEAIANLSVESANWREIMEQALEDLPDDVQSTIRNEISDLLNRGVAAFGAEVRCETDFFRNRMIQGLQNIKAKLLGQDPPPLEPQLCNVIPLAIDMDLPPNRRNKIEFYGYDFDRTNISVLLENTTGTVNVSNSLDRPTHYHMTLNLGGSGISLTPNSRRLILRWNNREISSIGIIQQSPDICRSRTVNRQPNPISYTPPHTRGDREFDGNGPNIYCRVRLIRHRTRVDAEIFFRARETESDWTTATGTRTTTIYTADTGWEITNIVGATESTYSYIDNDHALDSFAGSGPVSTYTFMGDGRGDDAGVHTRVQVAFNQLRFELKETGDCISERAISNAAQNNLISSERLDAIKKAQPNLRLDLQPNN